MRAKRTAYRSLVGEPEGKKPSGRLRRRWENNIKMGLRMGWCCLDSSDSRYGPIGGLL
jgi:hypothetical protein